MLGDGWGQCNALTKSSPRTRGPITTDACCGNGNRPRLPLLRTRRVSPRSRGRLCMAWRRAVFPHPTPPDKPPPMPCQVAAFYQFTALPDFRELREPLRAICAGLKLKGSVLLAHEGINGTLAGGAEAIAALVEELQSGGLFGGRLDNLERKFSQASDAVSTAENPAEEGNRHARRNWNRSDTAGRRLCRARRLERADRGAGYAPDRHPQCIRGRDGHIRGRARPGHQELWAIQGICRAPSRSRKAPQGGDVLHRRHPLRKGQRLSAGARFCASLSPQGRHSEISGTRAGSGEPLARGMFCLRRPRRARPGLARTSKAKQFR